MGWGTPVNQPVVGNKVSEMRFRANRIGGVNHQQAQAARAQRGTGGSVSVPPRVTVGTALDLQRTAGNAAVAGAIVVQRVSEQKVREDLASGRTTALMGGGFIYKHGSPASTNIDAAKIHASRNPQPLINTVLGDSAKLVQGLVGQPFGVGDGESWRVVSKQSVSVVNTRRRGQNIPEAPELDELGELGGDDVAIEEGEVQDIEGATEDEVTLAVQKAGRYPKNANSTKKREYRAKLQKAVNESRQANKKSQDAAWVTGGFSKISGVDIAANTHPTVDEIHNIPKQDKIVTVDIRKNTGEIDHLESAV
jgi:hypothetical protein